MDNIECCATDSPDFIFLKKKKEKPAKRQHN